MIQALYFEVVPSKFCLSLAKVKLFQPTFVTEHLTFKPRFLRQLGSTTKKKLCHERVSLIISDKIICKYLKIMLFRPSDAFLIEFHVQHIDGIYKTQKFHAVRTRIYTLAYQYDCE